MYKSRNTLKIGPPQVLLVSLCGLAVHSLTWDTGTDPRIKYHLFPWYYGTSSTLMITRFTKTFRYAGNTLMVCLFLSWTINFEGHFGAPHTRRPLVERGEPLVVNCLGLVTFFPLTSWVNLFFLIVRIFYCVYLCAHISLCKYFTLSYGFLYLLMFPLYTS